MSRFPHSDGRLVAVRSLTVKLHCLIISNNVAWKNSWIWTQHHLHQTIKLTLVLVLSVVMGVWRTVEIGSIIKNQLNFKKAAACGTTSHQNYQLAGVSLSFRVTHVPSMCRRIPDRLSFARSSKYYGTPNGNMMCIVALNVPHVRTYVRAKFYV